VTKNHTLATAEHPRLTPEKLASSNQAAFDTIGTQPEAVDSSLGAGGEVSKRKERTMRGDQAKFVDRKNSRAGIRPTNSPTALPQRLTPARFWLGSMLVLLSAMALVHGVATHAADEPRRYVDARLRMVEKEIAREGVTNEAVLKSARQVPRHQFVTEEWRPYAYLDQALPIGHKQTISPPFIVAYMTESLDPQPTDRVLEIGTGSGYQAAILSNVVQEVYTIEIVEPLGRQAAKVLREQGYRNVECKVGDGYKGWPEKAPFDKIIVTCSPESIPQPLVEQLKEGGRMIIPLGERYSQVFYLLEKQDGVLKQTKLLPALFVPMTGISEEKRQVKPDPTKPELRNGDFELLVQQAQADGTEGPQTARAAEVGAVEGWYYQRQLTVVDTVAPQGRRYVRFDNADSGRGAQMLQGMAVDGAKVSSLRISLQARATDIRSGATTYEKAGLIVHYFGPNREPVGEEVIGPWTGSFPWRKLSELIPVPPRAREAIIRIGLNGATGTLAIDDIKMTSTPR
jgi:protein-L-isoaspartate(D-aspartate) O-methyltransferase